MGFKAGDRVRCIWPSTLNYGVKLDEVYTIKSEAMAYDCVYIDEVAGAWSIHRFVLATEPATKSKKQRYEEVVF